MHCFSVTSSIPPSGPHAWNTSVNKTNLLASVSVLVGQTDNKYVRDVSGISEYGEHNRHAYPIKV